MTLVFIEIMNQKLFFLHLLVTHPQCSTYTFRDLQSNARGQDACRVSTDLGPDIRQIHKGGPPCNLLSVECQGRQKRRLRIEHKGYIPNHKTEIKIPDPVGNRTRAAGLEGRDSTDHATATVYESKAPRVKLQLKLP